MKLKLAKVILLILLSIIFSTGFYGCATTNIAEKNTEGLNNYNATVLLQNLLNNYENQNYTELRKLFGGELTDKFSVTESSIREEFKKYDFIKVTYNIEKVSRVNNFMIINFNWTKNRRELTSGSFSQSGSISKEGKSIFTFDTESGKLVQITGDYLFGIGGN